MNNSDIPADLKYAKSHEWVRTGADGTATIGITAYAQNSLGDITYVQLPQPGAMLKAGDAFGVVESVKAASDLYAPISGTVVEVNTGLDSAPEKVNQAPYGEGWLLKLKIARPAEPDALLDAAGYAALIG
ncbi:MAG: glycine cleavage system protein GcvH [Opitutaceae bacterium]|jgi:glycine cleavage system H protein|nr:glycine cleavage system protein GcvH [Opitutaceae bacterium]